MYLDGEGQCISPLYTWQDGRGNLPEFDGKALTEEISTLCGVKIATGYGLVTHLYNMRKGLVPKGSVSFCTIADYLGMVLTERKRPLLHSSMAASLGFFDGKTGTFQEESFRKTGGNPAILPEVTSECAVLGSCRGIPVMAAIGDNQASFLGAAGKEENTLLLNMGTGGQISVLSEQYFEGQGIEARPFFDGKYLLVGCSLCGGRAYALLEQFFRSYMQAACGNAGPQYGLLERLAEKGMESPHKLSVVTTFGGTRTDPAAKGSITGLCADNFTPEAFACGVLSGMAQELFEMYRVIQAHTGIRADRLIASGNGLRKNKVLQEICAEMFGAELRLAPCEEEAACGAAISSVL